MTKTATATKIDLPAMKRADRRRAEKELAYNRRDMRNMALVTGLAVALLYTSLWLVNALYAG